jgi:hypothetical protein
MPILAPRTKVKAVCRHVLCHVRQRHTEFFAPLRTACWLRITTPMSFRSLCRLTPHRRLVPSGVAMTTHRGYDDDGPGAKPARRARGIPVSGRSARPGSSDRRAEAALPGAAIRVCTPPRAGGQAAYSGTSAKNDYYMIDKPWRSRRPSWAAGRERCGKRTQPPARCGLKSPHRAPLKMQSAVGLLAAHGAQGHYG